MTKNINYNKLTRIFSFTTVIIFAFFCYFYKLGYESFFTDEIIFVKSGLEAITKNEYSLIMEVPLIGKYMAGFSALYDERNVYLMRIPYALLGLVTAFAIFKLLKREYGYYWGLLGFLLFILSPILYYSTRMVMLESPMHFFWILFSYYFLDFVKNAKWKPAIISGIVLGLAMGTKFTSIVLYPAAGLVVLVALFSIHKTKKLDFIKKSASVFIFSGIAFMLSYLDLIIHKGFQGMYDVLRSVKDRYISKETGGKIHVVDNTAYNYSPWWYYFYFIKKMYTYVQIGLYAISSLVIFLEKNIFVFYWTVLFTTIFTFQQALLVKSMRYFSSVELPLLVLTVTILRYIYLKVKNKKLWTIIIGTALLMITIGRLNYINKLQPTKYAALLNYLQENTNNFTNGERTYIFGSIRSSRWYFTDENDQKTRTGAFNGHTPEDAVVSRKDFGVIGKEFFSFKYIAVDSEEILKGQGIKLIEFLNSNPEKFKLVKFPGLDLFVRTDI